MHDYIGTEKVVHGRHWDAVHGGYFSDPAVARPLIDVVSGILARSPADVVVDLGGGTGFVLSQLAAHGIAAGSTMVNVDCSDAQLALAEGRDIENLCASVADIARGDIAVGEKRFFYMMRSVLHYVGEDGLSPLLRRLRNQAEQGEFFVHQTASFDDERDAACLNALYRHMHTDKWYPTVSELKRRLTQAGWRVLATVPAPALPLTSEDLGKRYGLDEKELGLVRDVVAAQFGEMDDVFRLTPSGFEAQLHYRIYICLAQTPENLN